MSQNQKKNKGILSIEQIQKLLPHRYPFLLVDRVISLDKGKSIVAFKNVTCNEPFFQGHFPSLKVMPGVLQVEALAQTGGILLYYSIPDPEEKIVFLSKIDNTKFRKPVVPGDQLRMEVTVLKLKKKICHIMGVATVDGEVAVESEIMASILSLEELHAQE